MSKFTPEVFGTEANALNALYDWQATNPEINPNCRIFIKDGTQGTVKEARSVAMLACANALPIKQLILTVASPKQGTSGIECIEGVPDDTPAKKLLEALKTSKHAARWLDRWVCCPDILYFLVHNTLLNIMFDVRAMSE